MFSAVCPTRLLFGLKLGFSRIFESLYGAFHAFGYNCAESEPNRAKSGALLSMLLGLALAYFGCNALQ